MDKAYDVKALAEKLKGRGLELAEDVAVMVLEETLDWVVESAIKSENKLDDLAAVVVPIIKKHALELAHKIHQEPAEAAVVAAQVGEEPAPVALDA